MRSSLFSLSAIFLAISSVTAQTSPLTPTSTITITPACPSAPPADVIVTRSAVVVPSCEAGSNSTKPSIVSMPGYGMNGSATGMGSAAQFTGAATRKGVSGVVAGVLGGMGVALMI